MSVTVFGVVGPNNTLLALYWYRENAESAQDMCFTFTKLVQFTLDSLEEMSQLSVANLQDIQRQYEHRTNQQLDVNIYVYRYPHR